ncbi:MAG TPA: hypothetical protein VLD19_08490, partial [Chitinophagaceae bacterium]|nr:hypothetical protein [Chitinophagaceae bacterium]
MARLLQPPKKYGTYCGLCVYQMHGDDFVRKASSLTGDRVKEEPAFNSTRAWAGRLAHASRLAGAVYDMLSPCRQRFYLYRKFTGIAMKLLTAGATEGEVVVELMQRIRLPKRKPRKKKAKHALVVEMSCDHVRQCEINNRNTITRRLPLAYPLRSTLFCLYQAIRQT